MRPNIIILAGTENTLFAEHLRWWREFYTVERRARGSFVALPDTRLEGYYYIQQSKIAQSMRADGVGLTDQTGPFRADLAVKCARAPPGANGTGWPVQNAPWSLRRPLLTQYVVA